MFLKRGDDPGVPVGLAHPLNQVVYLEELLPSWAEREPENPFEAVFAPLPIRDDAALRNSLPAVWRRIQEAPLVPAVQATLERMLEFWLIERFPTLSSEELRAMLNVPVPLEGTRAYQEIFAKGEAVGKAEGKIEGEVEGAAKGETIGKADSLKRLLTHRFGNLPRWALRRLHTADIAQLDGWLDASFEAQHLEDVMGPAPKRKTTDKP